MKGLYRALAFLVATGVFVEAASIAYGWFAVMHEVDAGRALASDADLNGGHALHALVGQMVLPPIALLLLVVAFVARIPGGVRLAAVVLGLVVLQVALAYVAEAMPWVGALHGANALAVVGASISAGIRAGRADPDRDPALSPAATT